ncbi:MAG: VOC family protein [Methanocorpusculum sp.]|nr:VOC family protein [Methanocorpusculum sp.]
MRFVCPLVVVKDIAASVRFYRELFGLEIEYDFGENVSFADGPALQSLSSFAQMTGVFEETIFCRPHNMELYFEEEAFDAFVSRLKAMPGIRYVHEVIEHPWGQRVVRIYDPNLHMIEIGESMEVVIRRCLAGGMSVEETAAKTQHPPEMVERIKNSGL